MVVKFWLVWRENGGVPTHMHANLDSAKREAYRLAEQCPGEILHVLESVGACVKRTVDWMESTDAADHPEVMPF